jgi:hypothetical protein
MIVPALLLLLAFAPPSWQSKPPAEWSEEQLLEMLTGSPWARAQAFLATAAPMKLAEAEWRRRHVSKRLDAPEPEESDYAEFMKSRGAGHVVLAVRIEHLNELAKAEEIVQMEKESWLRAGRFKVRITGHFPPDSADPYLRLVFPRPKGEFKSLKFDLYVPGVTGAYLMIEFDVKELGWRGTVEF